MAMMGRYCKAYPIARFREFSGWTENAENARKEKKELDDKTIEEARVLTDDDHLYLQENFTVTDGIFLDEYIIFGDVTTEWVNFCKETLMFEIPRYQTEKVN